MDLNKYQVLLDLAKEARIKDRETFDEMERTKAEWKKANEILTERNKVLKDYVDGCINEAMST
jgi:hypothetical protein